MNRRQFAIASVASTVALATGCDDDQKPSHTATLLNNAGVQTALQALADAIDTLVGDISEFDSENWREVVPKVTGSAEDVSTTFEKLRTALSVST